MSDTLLIVLSLLTGAVAGAVFRYLGAPIPAPSSLAGVMGIVGIYVGYSLIDHFGWTVDVLDLIGV
jgi:XapX domain-containing protein